MTRRQIMENFSMKALALSISLITLAACATNSPHSSADATSNYTATRQPDGSVALVVTGKTAAPTPSSEATLQLGDMLETAASIECPTGYDLTPDPAPSVQVDAGTLVATLRGVARCK